MTCRPDRRCILLYCHHSVGLGHLVRTLAVATAIAERFAVVVVSGGPVPPQLDVPNGVELVPMAPIASGADGKLASFDPGLGLGDAWDQRTATLLGLLEARRPSVVVVELFPFGRRKFARELIPLLEAAGSMRPRPVPVVSSVRDLLVAGHPDKQAHDDEAAERLERYFSAVIVHSDARVARLEETFSPVRPVRVPIFHSGFVVPRSGRPSVERTWPPEVLVSVGGGRVGAPLLRTAIEAQRTVLADRGCSMRLVTGPFCPEEVVEELRAAQAACPGLVVERFVPDLCGAMARAAVSVSQFGYNTTLDLVRAGVPAVVVPYDEDRESEQGDRAERLSRLGAVKILPSSELSPERLASEILGQLGSPRPKVDIDLRGAERTASIVSALADGVPLASLRTAS